MSSVNAHGVFVLLHRRRQEESFFQCCHVTVILWMICLVGSINTPVPFLAWLPEWRKTCWGEKKSLNQYGLLILFPC